MKFSISRQCEHPGCKARLEIVLEVADRGTDAARKAAEASDAAAIAAGWRRLSVIPPGLVDPARRRDLRATKPNPVGTVCREHIPELAVCSDCGGDTRVCGLVFDAWVGQWPPA